MARIDYEQVAADYHAARGLAMDGPSGWREALVPYLAGVTLPVLDIGSGTGQFAPLLAEWHGLDVIGVEPADAMRAEAERKNHHSHVRYFAGDAARLPVGDASCGAAWYSTVIHHIPDLPAAAREARRVLVAGAPVLIRSAFPGRTGRISLFRYFPEAARVVETFPSIEQVERDFGTAGFALEAVRPVPQVSVRNLEEMRRRAALRADTTLLGITDEAFEAGMRRLDAAIAAGDPAADADFLDLGTTLEELLLCIRIRLEWRWRPRVLPITSGAKET